jgi:glutamyl-tRNA synthetase
VIRLRAPQTGETVVEDQVQGRVVVQNEQLDDMVLLRSDGTPTYMLSVVVDDIDMGITHVIRGDDHLTNTFRQKQLYDAIGADAPVFAHVPLIHGPDGAKLSKRHGALAVEAYRDMGFLPATMRNYLLRLGWGHGDEEVIPTERAVEWFDLGGIGRAPSRLDFAKMEHLNGIYIRQTDDAVLLAAAEPFIVAALGGPIDETGRARLLAGMKGLKQRAKRVTELAESAAFYARSRPLALNDAATKLLDANALALLGRLRPVLDTIEPWTEAEIEARVAGFAETEGLKLGKVAQPLRAALTGSNVSPGIFEVAAILGRVETSGRIDDVLVTVERLGASR